MPQKMTRVIVSFPGWLTEGIKAYAKERGQTFSGAVREITRVRITGAKRKKENDKNQSVQARGLRIIKR